MSNSAEATPRERAMSVLRRKGNPFRQQFARNADDPVCSLYHVDDLFAKERRLLQTLVEGYRGQPDRPTCVLPVLGPRGAGKTHLLHCLKHGPGVAPEMFITPGTFRIDKAGADSSFLEYLLYQFINVLLSGGEQRGARPMDYVGEQLTRQVLHETVSRRDPANRLELTDPPWMRRLGWRFGVGQKETSDRIEQFLTALGSSTAPCRELAQTAQLDPQCLVAAADQFLENYETRDLEGSFRRKLTSHFIHATLLSDEAPLADFLTDGFVETSFLANPTRSQLTLSLLQALTKVIVGAGIPVAVAFDQLEELLYGQTDDEIRRSSDGFFGGLVQLMSQAPGLCVLLFVEEGLWNRIVPPLPSHILDRIHEPIHVDEHGTIRSVRLNAPSVDQLTQVVARRITHTLQGAEGAAELEPGFPFGRDFLSKLARKETVLRLMLQGCCNRLDEILAAPEETALDHLDAAAASAEDFAVEDDLAEANLEDAPPATTGDGHDDLQQRWRHEVRLAQRKLKPVGSLSGAAEDLRGGMVRWLHVCKSLGVEQGDWQMAAIDDHVQVGEHPTYGIVTVIEWKNKEQTRRAAIGMWLGRGVGKPRDLETKLRVVSDSPPLADCLILFRPSDDVRLSGRTREAWENAVTQGANVVLEPVELDVFAKLHAFPRWMQQVHDAFGDAAPEWVYSLIAEETESIMLKLGLPDDSSGDRAAA